MSDASIQNDVEATQEEARQSSTDAETTTEVTTDLAINASLNEIADPDTLRQMVGKLRRENANRRTQEKERDAELQEFRAWKESQMSELERTQATLAQTAGLLKEAQRDKLLIEFGLDADLAEFVDGETVEEMRTRAEKLASKKSAAAATEKVAADLAPGTRGAVVGSQMTAEEAGAMWLRANR